MFHSAAIGLTIALSCASAFAKVLPDTKRLLDLKPGSTLEFVRPTQAGGTFTGPTHDGKNNYVYTRLIFMKGPSENYLILDGSRMKVLTVNALGKNGVLIELEALDSIAALVVTDAYDPDWRYRLPNWLYSADPAHTAGEFTIGLLRESMDWNIWFNSPEKDEPLRYLKLDPRFNI